MHWEPFLVLSGISFILGFERLFRFRTQQATLTHKTFLVLMFALGVAAAAYGTMPLTAQFHNIGLGTWRTLSAVLIGALEIIILVLRSPQVDPAAVRRVIWRSGIVTTVLLVTYILGFADAPPIRDLSQSAPTNAAVIVHMAAFGAYIMWGLANMILLCVQRVPKEMRRRTIHATALVLVTAGCTGFLWINAVAISSLVLDFNVNVDILYAPAPVFVGNVGGRRGAACRRRACVRRTGLPVHADSAEAAVESHNRDDARRFSSPRATVARRGPVTAGVRGDFGCDLHSPHGRDRAA